MSGDFVEPLHDDPPLHMLPELLKLTFFSETEKKNTSRYGYKNFSLKSTSK